MLNTLSNLEKLQSIAVHMSVDNAQIIEANKVFLTWDEFISSEELREVHSGFQSSTSITKNMFSKAWVSGKDVYVQYKADGINFIKKESISSMLSNSGLYDVIPCEHLGFIINKNNCYDKGHSNRKIFRQQDWRVLTSA